STAASSSATARSVTAPRSRGASPSYACDARLVLRLRASPSGGVADLEHLGGEAAERVGDVADGTGHDHGHAGDGLRPGLDRVLHGVLGDLGLAQVVAHGS